jgi:hypothetical protein
MEKETSRAEPRFLGIAERVPVVALFVVVTLTGEYLGFVRLAFLVSAFAGKRLERHPLLVMLLSRPESAIVRFPPP